METIDLSNCCYPPEQSRTYEVEYSHTLKDGVLLEGPITVKLGPGQNVEFAVDEYLARTNTIYFTNYKLIRQI